MADERFVETEGQVETQAQVDDQLTSTMNPDQEQADNAVQDAQAAVDQTLEANGISEDDTNEWQRQNAAESETDAEVEADMTGDDADGDTVLSEGERISSSQMDNELPSDVPENCQQAKEGVENAQAAVDQTLEANGISEDNTNQWQRWNTAESATDSEVEKEMNCDAGNDDTVVSEGQDISKEQLDNELAPDIPETEQQAQDAEADAAAAADNSLDATGVSLDNTNEWQRQNTDEAETNAIVEEEAVNGKKDLPDYLL